VPWLCLHLAVGLVPLAMADFTWLGFSLPLTFDSFDAPKVFLLQVLTLVSLGAWGWGALTHGTQVWRSRAFWLLLAFLAWAGLATLFSIHLPTALVGKARRLEGWLTFACYAWLLFLAVQEVRSAERLRSLARTLVLAGSVVAVYGLLQYFGLDPIERSSVPFESHRAYSTLGNPDLLGGYLLFPLPLALALALTEARRAWKAVYWVGFLLLVGVWVTAFVRGAWIGGVIALAIVVLLAARLRLRPGWLDVAFVAASAGSAALFVGRSLGSDSEVTNFASRVRSIFSFGEGSAQTRFEIWQTALTAIRERPLLGYGPDTFRLVFPRYKPAAYVRDAGHLSVADNAHNYVLQTATGLGVPGALLLYGFFGVVLVGSLWRILRDEHQAPSLVRGAFWAGCVGYLIHLMFGISVSGSSTLLWVGLGVLLAPAATAVWLSAPSWGRWARYVAAGVVGVALLGSVSLFAADHFYLRAQVATDPAARLSAARMAVRLNPFVVLYRGERGNAHRDQMGLWLRTATAQMQAGADASVATAGAAQEFEAAAQAYRDLIAFAPWEYDTYPNLAILYLRAGVLDPGNYERALEVARQTIAVAPNAPYGHLLAADALRALGRLDEAVAAAEKAASLDPHFADPHALLGQLHEQKGDLESARRHYQAALDAAPAGPLAPDMVEALARLEASGTAG